MRQHLFKYFSFLLILTLVSILVYLFFLKRSFNVVSLNYYLFIPIFYFFFVGVFHTLIVLLRNNKNFTSFLFLAIGIKFIVFLIAIIVMYLALKKNFKQYSLIFLIHYIFYITFEIYFLKEILIVKNKNVNNLQSDTKNY